MNMFEIRGWSKIDGYGDKNDRWQTVHEMNL